MAVKATKGKAVTKAAPKAKAAAPVAAKAKGGSIYSTLRNEMEASGSRTEFWQPRSETQVVRLVPYVDADGNEKLFLPQSKHWGLEKDGRQMPLACGGADCPVCELKGEVEDSIQARIRKQTQYLCNVIVRGGKGGEDKLVVAQLPKSVGDGLAEYIDEESKRFIEGCLDPKKGNDFRIIREFNKKKKFWEYKIDSCMSSPWGKVMDDAEIKDLSVYELNSDDTLLATAAKRFSKGDVAESGGRSD